MVVNLLQDGQDDGTIRTGLDVASIVDDASIVEGPYIDEKDASNLDASVKKEVNWSIIGGLLGSECIHKFVGKFTI